MYPPVAHADHRHVGREARASETPLHTTFRGITATINGTYAKTMRNRLATTSTVGAKTGLTSTRHVVGDHRADARVTDLNGQQLDDERLQLRVFAGIRRGAKSVRMRHPGVCDAVRGEPLPEAWDEATSLGDRSAKAVHGQHKAGLAQHNPQPTCPCDLRIPWGAERAPSAPISMAICGVKAYIGATKILTIETCSTVYVCRGTRPDQLCDVGDDRNNKSVVITQVDCRGCGAQAP